MLDDGVDDQSGAPTFRMDRLSQEASKLKAAVLRKLLQFLADYSDDVLAEYIVVLVCNGKTQNQARDDLRDFLGHDSDHFVFWLWDYLSHKIFKPSKRVGITKSGREYEIKPLAAHSDNPLSDRYQPSTSPSPPSGPTTLNNFRPPLPDFVNERRDLKFEKTEVTLESYEASGSKSAASSAENCGGALCQDHQLAAYCQRYPVYELPNQKVARRNSSEQPSQAQHVPKKGMVIKKQRVFSAAFQGAEGPILSTFLNREAHHIQRQRGNVWDRLGKPIEEDDAVLSEKKGRLITDDVKRRRLELAERPNCSFLSGTTDPIEQSRKLNQCLAGQAFKIETEAPIKYKAQQMNKYTLDEKKSVVPSHRLGKQTVAPAGIVNHDHQVNDDSKSQSRREHQVINTLQRSPLHDNNLILSISDPPENSGGVSGSRRPIEYEVLDVKSRLHQIELEMLNLRSRQAEMCNSIKPKSLSGLHNPLDEDQDSRTVIVTNVHFAASKEAVVSYFSKCGNIVKVVLLTNSITAQLKGTAHVTFASKESVEKAVMLSGTSFYSRILTVLRKAEAPARFLVPSGKLGRPCIMQQVRRQGGSLQRHRLRWVRNQAGKGAEVATATEHGVEASCTE